MQFSRRCEKQFQSEKKKMMVFILKISIINSKFLYPRSKEIYLLPYQSYHNVLSGELQAAATENDKTLKCDRF